MKIELPPCPEPWCDTIHGWAFTAEQMLAFRAEGIRVALEAAAKACDAQEAPFDGPDAGIYNDATDACAASVRALMEDKP